MAEITQLPDEIIVFILENKSIAIKDVINFKSTCERLQCITLDNCFWKKKICHRYSTATKTYYLQKLNKNGHLNFEKQIKTKAKYIKKLHYYVSLISDNNLTKIDKEELELFLLSTVKNSIIYHFVLDDINRINSTQLLWPLDSHLTFKYNFDLILHSLIQHRFMYKQTTFLTKPIKKQLPERQITILAQYFLPYLSYSVIKKWLDDIAQDMLTHIKIKYPSHPILSISPEYFLFWKTNNIYNNYWDSTESTQIIRALEEYVLSDIGINKLFQFLSLIIPDLDAKYKKIADYFINDLLTITYHCVARRLGICCILMLTVYKHLQIVWKPKYNTVFQDNAEYFYITGKFSHKSQPLNIVRGTYEYYNNISPSPLYNDRLLHILENILYNFNTILQILNIMNYKWKFQFLHTFLCSKELKNIRQTNDTHRVILRTISQIFYERITNVTEVGSIAIKEEAKRRRKIIKYPVGIIVKHYMRRAFVDLCPVYHYGVIIGWHYKYNLLFKEQLMKTKAHQFPYLCPEYVNKCMCEEFLNTVGPYYIILSENNKICYVRQDDILLCLPREINNIEIGRFFYKFQGTHYVPNKYLEQNYPSDDNAAILKFLRKNRKFLR